MLRHQLNGMIEVPRLEDENAAELFLGFRIGAVGRHDSAVLPVQGHRGLRRLKRYFGDKMSVGAQMVVVLEAFVEYGVLLVLGHPFERSRLEVTQTHVFHRPSSRFNLYSPGTAEIDAKPSVYCTSLSRRARNRRSGSPRTRASALSYDSRASTSLPSLRHKSARAECARW